MNWYARNNSTGGFEIIMSAKPPAGYLAITPAQCKALPAAPLGTRIDAEGNPKAPAGRAEEPSAPKEKQ